MDRRAFLFLPLVLAAVPQAQAQTAAPDISQYPKTSTTKGGRPGDPINVGLIGTRDEIIAAMAAAGWQQPVPVSLKSSAKIAGSVAFRRAYLTAPVSTLLYLGRRQDLAFEKEVGKSASRRHHVRFWKVLDNGPGNRPLWLGGATFDKGVGFSHRNGAVTHHINGDVDAERDFLMAEIARAQRLQQTITITGKGPINSKNGGGDAYWTDGNVSVAIIAAGAALQAGPATPAP